jgi:hypothetical protein
MKFIAAFVCSAFIIAGALSEGQQQHEFMVCAILTWICAVVFAAIECFED